MKPVHLLLSALALASCSGASEPPACRGDVFPLNPSRVAPLAGLTGAPAAAPAVGPLR